MVAYIDEQQNEEAIVKIAEALSSPVASLSEGIQLSDSDKQLFDDGVESLKAFSITAVVHLLQAKYLGQGRSNLNSVEITELPHEEQVVLRRARWTHRITRSQIDVLRDVLKEKLGASIGGGISSAKKLGAKEGYEIHGDSPSYNYDQISDQGTLFTLLKLNVITIEDLAKSVRARRTLDQEVEGKLVLDGHKFLLELTKEPYSSMPKPDYLAVMNEIMTSDRGSLLIEAWNKPYLYVGGRVIKKLKSAISAEIQDEFSRCVTEREQLVRLRIDIIRNPVPVTQFVENLGLNKPTEPNCG